MQLNTYTALIRYCCVYYPWIPNPAEKTDEPVMGTISGISISLSIVGNGLYLAAV